MGQAQAKKEPTPKGEITNRTTGEVTKAPKKLVEKVERGFAIKREMDALKEELDGINSQLIEEVGPNHTIEVEGLVKASISESQRVKVAQPGTLRGVLGQRFEDLVREETRYEPEPKLKEMAFAGDDPQADKIRDALTISTSRSVSYKAA